MFLAFCIGLIADILIYILIAQAILSWFVNPYSSSGISGVLASIFRILSSFTHPLTRPARALLRKINTGPLDLSLFLTVLLIILLRAVLTRLVLNI
jgi:uncharacterized protein YggT (Ycf19 family)